jgi:hypothetical protein
VVPRRQAERALEQAEIMRVFDLDELHDVLAHANGRRGAGILHEVLAELADEPGLTDNDLEDRFLDLCRAAACRSRRSTNGSKSTTVHPSKLILCGQPNGSS